MMPKRPDSVQLTSYLEVDEAGSPKHNVSFLNFKKQNRIKNGSDSRIVE